ncbi:MULTISPECIES: hypothetical protein [Streptococcus]|uniref:hypothetical protein n=1 Tax=Streptococcus TaxID=1301 RepID=UPI00160558CC|nr:hypothetical protein [Streptococcus iniae]
MKVKTLLRFKDLKEDKIREIGDEFEVTKTRFKEIDENLPNFIEEVKADETKNK